jgi:hypothetical protein
LDEDSFKNIGKILKRGEHEGHIDLLDEHVPIYDTDVCNEDDREAIFDTPLELAYVGNENRTCEEPFTQFVLKLNEKRGVAFNRKKIVQDMMDIEPIFHHDGLWICLKHNSFLFFYNGISINTWIV